MKITVFTSNHLRHKYLVHKLSKKFNKVLYVCEKKPYIRTKKSKLVNHYFKKVKKTEKKIFTKVKLDKKKIEVLNFKYKNISFKKLLKKKNFINSDYFLVYGSSLIKGELLKYLIQKKALNLHMGLLPYYRGTDCNFWAVHDGNFDKIGASLIHLSSKIDKGNIVKLFKTTKVNDKFKFTMLACKNAIEKAVKFLSIKNNKFKSKKINKKKLLRFSRFREFNDNAIRKFMSSKLI